MKIFWLEQTEADLPLHDDWLSPDEVLRMNGMHFAKRRSEWRLGRWTAKCAVTIYLRCPTDHAFLAGMEIRTAPSGAPEVTIKGNPAGVVISISHRAGVAICAVGSVDAALGCDLELIEPRCAAFVCDYFTQQEQELLATVSTADRWLLVALLWSAKESALKALREGLRLSTHSVVVFPDELPRRTTVIEAQGNSHSSDSIWHPLRVCCAGGENFKGWWQCTNEFVRTMLSAPSSQRPLCLEVPWVRRSVDELGNGNNSRINAFSLPRCF